METTYKVHQGLYIGLRQCRETQLKVDLRVLHIFDRPGIPSMLRERVY